MFHSALPDCSARWGRTHVCAGLWLWNKNDKWEGYNIGSSSSPNKKVSHLPEDALELKIA